MTQQEHAATWLESRHGQFALNRLRALVLGMTKNWRPNSRVLVCGHLPDVFAPALANAGFEVSCAGEASQIARARQLDNKRLDLHVASLDHLPFSRREFDNTLVLLAFSPERPLNAVLREAERVTRREIVLTGLNRSSLFYKKRDVLGQEAKNLLWTTWRELQKYKAEQENILLQRRSILQPPPTCWSWWPHQLDKLPLPFGAFVAARIALRKERLSTPLVDKIKEHNLLQTGLPEACNRTHLGEQSTHLPRQNKSQSV